jgi:hypothetical protein
MCRYVGTGERPIHGDIDLVDPLRRRHRFQHRVAATITMSGPAVAGTSGKFQRARRG